MAECIPLYTPAQNVTCRAVGAVTGGTFVVISGSAADDNIHVATAGAGVRPFGVALTDAVDGAAVSVTRGGIVPITAAAALTANQDVEVAANGQATPLAAGVRAGSAAYDAASGAKVYVALAGLG